MRKESSIPVETQYAIITSNTAGTFQFLSADSRKPETPYVWDTESRLESNVLRGIFEAIWKRTADFDKAADIILELYEEHERDAVREVVASVMGTIILGEGKPT